MVSTRGCATREVCFGVGNDIIKWFPAPDESPVSTNVHSGDSQRLLNGLAYMGGSVYGGRHYELSWSFLNREQANTFRELFMNRTGEWVTYLDPFSMKNVLSPLMGLPYLHYHVGSPFAFNDWGKQALFPTKANNPQSGHPGVVLKSGVLQINNKFQSTVIPVCGRCRFFRGLKEVSIGLCFRSCPRIHTSTQPLTCMSSRTLLVVEIFRLFLARLVS